MKPPSKVELPVWLVMRTGSLHEKTTLLSGRSGMGGGDVCAEGSSDDEAD
jgi:hypothetical protein